MFYLAKRWNLLREFVYNSEVYIVLKMSWLLNEVHNETEAIHRNNL